MKLFIGFDIRTGNMQIMHADKPTDAAEVDYLQFKSRIFTEEYFEEAKTLLEEYFVQHPTLQNLQAYVVLPNEAVGFETFNLPNMKHSKMAAALDTELANLYEGRQKDNKINVSTLFRNRQYTTMGTIYFNKKLIAQIYRLLTDVKVFPKETTYSGNAMLNSVFSFLPQARGKSFVFADVHNEYTEIAISSKGKTQGVAVVPHGLSLLKSDKVELEYMKTNHDVGELAVINAREAAKAKALTVDYDPSVIPEDATIEDYAVQNASPAEQEAARQAEEQAAEQGAEQPTGPDGAPLAEAQPAEGDDFYESEEEEAKRLAEEAKTKLRKVKVFKKMPKRFPKFMMREPPETVEGIQFENWRIVLKWILLYARQAQLTEYTDNPDFILVNLPQEYRFLLDKTNEDGNNDGLKLRPFEPSVKLHGTIRGNLNLYGGMFASHFNKKHNF